MICTKGVLHCATLSLKIQFDIKSLVREMMKYHFFNFIVMTRSSECCCFPSIDWLKLIALTSGRLESCNAFFSVAYPSIATGHGVTLQENTE